MAIICSPFSKYLILVLICASFSAVELKKVERAALPFDFEKIKNDLFWLTKFSVLDLLKLKKSDLQCFDELKKIKNGLQNTEQWAMKLVDSWGKIPSAVFSGNSFEFGGFSECFHIERDQKSYDTKYCLGNLILNIDSLTNPHNAAMNPMMLEEESMFQARMAMPQPETGTAITFGVCLPTTCSLDYLEQMLNNIIQSKMQNVTVKLPSKTCQFEESPSFENLHTLDKVTLGILGVVFCLILLSTGYDILCTATNRNKSEVCLAFSFYTNGRKLLSYKKSKSPDAIDCVNGIRVLTTQWVVIGHVFIMYVFLPTRNKTSILTFTSEYHNMYILSAFISVDTFFVLSGLFVSISMLKHLEKTKGRMNVPLLFLHRYLRLTPLLIMTILFSMSLLRFLGSGPLWPNMIETLNTFCERYWWSALLYVQNYVNTKETCLGHSWYLSVDMQLFWIAPIVVYSIYRYKAKIIPVWILFVLGCVAYTLFVFWKYNYKGFMDQNKMFNTYFQTHMRYSPWLVGIIAGYFFFKTQNQQIRIPKLFNLFAWTCSLAIMGTVIFINYPLIQVDSKATSIEFGLYEGLSRVAWAVALCYIIFACSHGYGGPINYFLSHPLWQPLSRLSYSIYIVHFLVIIVTMATIKTSPYFSELGAWNAYLGNYVIIVGVAMIATLAFESPIIVLEKLIFSPKKKPQKDDCVNDADEVHTNEDNQVQNGELGKSDNEKNAIKL